MPAFTTATRNTMIDWLSGVANPAAVAPRYLTIFNGDPQAGGVENIAAMTGSADRVPITGSMVPAASGQAATGAQITFTNSAVGVATVNFLAIMSAITGGVVMASAPCTPKTVTVGDGLIVPVGNLTTSIM